MVNWWNLIYRISPWITLGRHQSPWDTDDPPKELIELVEGGRVRPCRVLDVGCGTGSYTIYLSTKGFNAVGIDVSSFALKKARAKAAKRNVDCRFHEVNFLSLKALSSVVKEPFDLVMDYGCLHSIKTKDRGLYAPSLKYVTHPKSLYFLWTFLPESSNIKFLGGLGNVDPEEVRELFSRDFKILEERNVTREKMFYLLERIHDPRRSTKENSNGIS
jgi:SAM-dependent methyltransferase